MLSPCLLRRAVLTVPLVFVVALLLVEPVRSDQEVGTAIPAESTYHPTVLSYSLYGSSNVAGLHITKAVQIMQTILDMIAYVVLKPQLDNVPVLFFSCIQGSPLSYLPSACCCLVCTWNLPPLCTFSFVYTFLCFNPFYARDHSVCFSEMLLRLSFFSTDIVSSLPLSFLVMSTVLKSVVFILKNLCEDAKKAHFVST